MPNIDLSILNQRQTPAFFASSLATRPAFGFAGRIFIDSDVPSTGLYRDTGSAWVQIADPGAGTTGTLQQVTTNGNTTTLRIIGQSFQGNAVDGDYFLKSEDIEFRNQAISDSFRLVGGGDPTKGFIYFGATGTNYIGFNSTNLVLNSSVTIPSLTTGSVPFIGASGLISQDNANLFWDATNGHFGIGTNTPGTALDVKHNQSTVLQLEQEVATNDNRIAFINSGVGLWRLGAFYNAGANDFGLFDIAAATQPVTIKRTTGQVLIGTSTVGSGKLVVASSTGDNGVQIVGAAAPSLRIDNAESGPTKRAGLGISTAANNFIQGSVDRDFCIFNGSTTASPILFGIYDTTNVAEAARISAARNFIVGKTTDSGQKLQISGQALITSNVFSNSSFIVSANGNDTIGAGAFVSLQTATGTNYQQNIQLSANGNLDFWGFDSASWNNRMRLVNGTGNLLIGTTTDAGQKLQVNGTTAITANGGHLTFIRSGYNTFQFGIGITSGINGFVLSDATSGINPLIIAQTTGNATFSGSIAIGNSVAGAIAAPSTHKVSIVINGVQYYLLASNI